MNKKSISKEWFRNKYRENEISGGYLRLTSEASTRMHHEYAIKALREFAPGKSYKTIVDIGCACGDFSAKLLAEFPGSSVSGIDFVQEGLDVAKDRYPDVNFINGALPLIPVKEDTADLLVLMEVLYYLSNEDLDRTIQELKRVGVSGSIVLVSITLGHGMNKIDDLEIKKLFSNHAQLLGVQQKHAMLQAMANRFLSKLIRLFDHVKFKSLRNIALYAKDSITLAKFNYTIAKFLLGKRSITKAVYVFQMK